MPQKYAIHPDFAKLPVLRVYFNRPFVGLANAALAFLRRGVEKNIPAGLVEDKITVVGASGRMTDGLRMRPENLSGPAPTLIYYHGGGFALTHGAHHLAMCRQFALEAGCQVIFPDYRLLPKYPFPAGFDDCYDTLTWVLEQAGDLTVDRARVAVGGDSAGGALAAGVAQKALDNGISLAAQLLIYPLTDSTGTTQSTREFVDTPVWNGRNTERMWRSLLPSHDRNSPPVYVAPGMREDLANLPPAYIDTAEFDPLRDEGARYAEDLQAAGVAVEYNATKGTVHAFELVPNSAITREIIQQRIQFLRGIFDTVNDYDLS